jgi:hypothetical protein
MMMRNKSTTTICLLAALLFSGLRLNAADKPRPIPIVLDTDIGSDIDDAFAVALIQECGHVDACPTLEPSGSIPQTSFLSRNRCIF